MVRTRTDHIILWPSYFDIRNRRSSGRRIPRNLAVERPTVQELYKAVNSIGLEAVILEDKSHPRRWWEHEGCLSVEKSITKTELIKQVAPKLKEMRQK